jgi:hypothetical protein
MGLSNPDRASATSIYTHAARLFIPSFYPSLSPRIACPVSFVLSASHCMSCQLADDAVRVLSALYSGLVPDGSKLATLCMSSQRFSLSSQPLSPRIACPVSSRIACPVSSLPFYSDLVPDGRVHADDAVHVLSARPLSPCAPVPVCMSSQPNPGPTTGPR